LLRALSAVALGNAKYTSSGLEPVFSKWTVTVWGAPGSRLLNERSVDVDGVMCIEPTVPEILPGTVWLKYAPVSPDATKAVPPTSATEAASVNARIFILNFIPWSPIS
jgi:hypothetical protein